MRLCLVEDLAVCALEPLTLTRPVHELVLGPPRSRARLLLRCELDQDRSAGAVSSVRTWSRLSVTATRTRWSMTVTGWRGSGCRGQGYWVPPVGFVPPDEFGPWVGLCDGQPACASVGSLLIPLC